MFFWALSGFQPSRERFANDLDLACFDIRTDHFHHAFQQESRVRVTLVAFDDRIVAIGLNGLDRFPR